MRRTHHRARHASRRSRLSALSAALLLAGVTVVTAVAVAATPAPRARADEVTASQNLLRDGWDPNEPGLSPQVLQSGSFGQIFATPVNGQVYAQPIVAGQTVVVATQNDYVYGLNAATGAINWSVSLGTPWPTATAACTDVTPNVGVMSTPVYDPSTGTVYLISEVVPPGADAYHPEFFMHALNAQTGTELPGWPVQIKGAPVNDPTRPFYPYAEWQRPALLLMGGSVYAAFASHCDQQPFDGYVVGVNTSTKSINMWTDESGLTSTEAGIWQSGGGLMSDGPGRIFVTSGNGVSPAVGPGAAPPTSLGDSVIQLAVGAGGVLSAKDFFSPSNAPTLDATDRDFGSGGPVGLPFGTSTYPDLLVQAGKDGRVFLLNRNSLGGRSQGPNGTDLVVSQAGPYQGQWGHPAVFGDTTTLTASNAATANDYLYYVGRGDVMRALKFGLDSTGTTPVLSDVANSAGKFGFTSGSPVVTSNGTDPSSAVVWEVYAGDATGAGGTLEAFQAVPSSSCSSSAPCTLTELWSAPIGNASKFAIPATDNGRVYVGTRDGMVYGFGSPDSAPLSGASPVSFGQVAVGTTSAPQTVTVGATQTVTINSISTTSGTSANPFTAGTPVDSSGNPVTLPVTLQPGDTLSVPVTMTPTSPGGATAALDFATSATNFPTISVGLSGTGTKPGFYAQPGSLSLGSLPVGTSTAASVVITNGGTTSETVSSVTQPGGPFTVTGLPSGTIPAGASVTATVTYQPTTVGTDSGQIVIKSGDGTSLTIGLSGTGIADVSQFTAAPTALNFGSVPVGTSATQTVVLTNSGNLPATITTTAPPVVPFGNPDPIPAKQPFNPGYDMKIPVTFTPASAGTVSSSYSITWTDAAGAHTISIPVTGTGIPPSSGIAVPPPGGGWTLNGSAQMSGTALSLTQTTANQAGSAVYAMPQNSNGLHATFTAQIGGGTGGNGLTMALLNASGSKLTALGGRGAQLGWGGLSGVAISLVTTKSAGEPSSNFIGIATGTSGGVPTF
ncbi:MAG: choice-of-anchor D domain-containing protein, partial [Streptosporangiaceae bacterium]